MLQNTCKTMGFKKIMVYEIPHGGAEVNQTCREILMQIVRLDGYLHTAGFPWKPILRTRCNGERISL